MNNNVFRRTLFGPFAFSAILLCTFALAACGGGGGGSGATSSAPESAPPNPTPTPQSPFSVPTTIPIATFGLGYFYNPELALNDAGKTLFVYVEGDSLLGTAFNGTSQGATYLIADATEYALWSAKTHQVVINDAGVGGVVFRAQRDPITSEHRYGFAYYDGSSWTYSYISDGRVDFNIGTGYPSRKSKIIAVDSNGVVFVAFTAADGKVNVARFDQNGFIGASEFEVTSLAYLSANSSDDVILYESGHGSRIRKGTTWSNLIASTDNGVLAASLKFLPSGNADFIEHDINIIRHFHFDGTGWATVNSKVNANPMSRGAAAIDDNGRSVVTWYNNFAAIEAAYFDGTSWTTPVPLNSSASSLERAPVFYDRAGRFVAVSIDNTQGGFAGYFFDGTWHGPYVIQSWAWGDLDPAMAMNRNGKLVIAADAGAHDNLSVLFTDFAP